MVKPGDLIVVHLVDKVPVGYTFERRRLSWPLHITLVPWFSAADEAVVDESLEAVAAKYQPFTATVGEITHFGAQNEVVVNIIEDNSSLDTLHGDVYKTLTDLQVVFVSEQYVGKQYRAHITRHEPDGHFKSAGDIEPIADFHLVRIKDSNTCEVIKKYTLGYNK